MKKVALRFVSSPGPFLLVLLHASFIANVVFAQDEPARARPDSMLSYDLAEIVVSDGTAFAAEPNTMQKVGPAELGRQNAAVVSDVARLISAAHIQTNSRGESLLYLRNAGERQVALFFNGAMLNVPWDNRITLDMVPAGLIGGITVSKGVPSTLYGTNVLGGAVNITSRSLETDGSVTEIGGSVGQFGTSNVGITHLLKHRHLSVTGSAGYNTRNSIALSKGADLDFNQANDSRRTNTDREMINMFVQGSYRFDSGAKVGLSYLFVEGAFGIAPEGHIDPVTSSVRFWRYPHWRNGVVILNASVPLGTASIFRGAAWGSRFAQDISAYNTSGYDILEEQQQDEDQTFGTRLTWIQGVGPGHLSATVNLLTSDHEELMLEANEQGRLIAPTEAPVLYRQTVYSLGAEYAFALSTDVRFTLGSSLDGVTMPHTGDKPTNDPVRDIGITSGLQYSLSGNTHVRAAAGRKVRFPTMRELFGVALNRFLLNPDLRPETSFASELGIVRTDPLFSGEIIGFYQRTYDTIDQHNVEVDGQQLRQRINLEGSRVWGVEMVGRAHLHPLWEVDGHLTGMNVRSIEEGETSYLTEKPAWLGRLAVIHRRESGISALGEIIYTGKAYGRAENNDLVALPASVVVDAKVGYQFVLKARPIYGDLFLRVDNLFDVATFPQLGLPGAGRFLSLGVDFSF